MIAVISTAGCVTCVLLSVEHAVSLIDQYVPLIGDTEANTEYWLEPLVLSW
jgi:hypothetical protein